jgi:hypothetical protein
MSTTIHVPMVPPSGNVLRRRYRSPHAYRRLRQRWEQSLAYSVRDASERNALIKQAAACRIHLKVTLIHKGTFDDDNLYSALKPVLDALVRVGYLRDDSAKWLELEAVQAQPARHDVLHLGATILELEAL